MYFIHLELPRIAEAASLYADLVGNPYAAHQVLWRMFGGEVRPGAEQPFLYHLVETNRGLGVYLLSETLPVVPAPWRMRSREFAPKFVPGQRLSFRLRFCPYVSRAQGSDQRSAQVNAVHEAYHPVRGQRSLRQVAEEVGKAWLDARAAGAGVSFLTGAAESYNVVPVERRSQTFRIPVLDMSGQLEVQDPAAFLARIASGWGKSRYAGCGLMLLSRPIE